MVADPTKPKADRVNYRNALQGVYRMVREEGAGSLARGLAPNTVRPLYLLTDPRMRRAASLFSALFNGVSTQSEVHGPQIPSNWADIPL